MPVIARGMPAKPLTVSAGCALQSGRLPVHVNHENADPAVHNPADTVSGFAGIPRAMTGIAEHLKRSTPPYATHFVGKVSARSYTLFYRPGLASRIIQMR
jgi:hypothetical protein|eukprot:COSAG01_NODE_6942_length_3429_cov_7.702703_2_plen_100_part_00